jgi:hypothetical protein
VKAAVPADRRYAGLAAQPFGSAGELVEPVADEGGFRRPEREGGLVRGGERGIEGEAREARPGSAARGGSVAPGQSR